MRLSSIITLLLISFFYGNGQKTNENSDPIFEKNFNKNFKFDCSLSDSEKKSSLMIFELKINEDGKIKEIVSWNENKWCNYSSFKEAFYKTDYKWLKRNSNTNVLVPVLIIWNNESLISNDSIMSNIDYKKVLKFEKLGKTKFLRPLVINFLKDSIR